MCSSINVSSANISPRDGIVWFMGVYRWQSFDTNIGIPNIGGILKSTIYNRTIDHFEAHTYYLHGGPNHKWKVRFCCTNCAQSCSIEQNLQTVRKRAVKKSSIVLDWIAQGWTSSKFTYPTPWVHRSMSGWVRAWLGIRCGFFWSRFSKRPYYEIRMSPWSWYAQLLFKF